MILNQSFQYCISFKIVRISQWMVADEEQQMAIMESDNARVLSLGSFWRR
jgi:hypothetical protein